MRRIPVSTYRLQMNSQFPLSEALRRVDYLKTLGISDLYLSPIFAASPGSTHGYDVVDFTRLNPDLGTEEDLAALAEKLHSLDMGLVLDIVPNHMCIASDLNTWWNDVLKHGERSSYARFFDIDWHSGIPDLKDKVLQPFLDRPLKEAIDAAVLQVGDKEAVFFGRHYPLGKAGDAPLKTMEAQNYRLDFWKRAFTDLNYRRFFEISELAALREEENEVFEAVHRTLFRWIDRGWVTGLRIDHIDGLHDPKGYLQRLRARCSDLYIVVEKILEEGETLNDDWPIQGTTGYDTLNVINGAFVKDDLTEAFHAFTGEVKSIGEIIRESKSYFLKNTMRSEWRRLAAHLSEDLHSALFAFLQCFPIYRTYVCDGMIDNEDRAILQQTVEAAKKITPDARWEAFSEQMFSDRAFLARLQMTTAPLAAKGIEDTAFYRYFPLASLNEVGSSMKPPAVPFHEACRRLSPLSLSPLTTHDTKRSEDVRARINAISNDPTAWKVFIGECREMHRNIGGDPDAYDEYLFYQTVVGTWPETGITNSYIERIVNYMIKAAKEAKRHTSWIDPNEAYETHLATFVKSLLHANSPFALAVEKFVQEKVLPTARRNTLAQTLLKMTLPGIPDFYQGSETTLLTLVDPDNRGIVNYTLLENSLKEGSDIKQRLVQKTLRFRHRYRDLFTRGEYIPLDRSDGAIAFMRRLDDAIAVISLGPPEQLTLPEGNYRDIFEDESFEDLHLLEKICQ
ncbi:MAG: malto-oligosyltrehalose synthase [Chlamydiales bacterium]|nr:malto-oligosyltrehalose synthase [Chlamydiia bacterium]MCP5506822.1 malto-oligosyltrehalose synthase [Chlamydiales bacterium]